MKKITLILLLSLLQPPLALRAQEGPPGAPESVAGLEAHVDGLFRRTLRGSLKERDVARGELDRLTRTRWGPLFDVYVKTRDTRLQSMLRHQLGIARAQECELIVKGTISKIEHVQGGVVDYHDLYLHFEEGSVEVLKGRELSKDYMPAPTMLRIARGTSRDTWLCELMRKELLRQPRSGLWTLKARSLGYPYGTATTAFQHFEFEYLPPEAERASEDLTGNCSKKQRR